MSIENEQQLEERLSRPTPCVIESMRRVDGDVIVLGAGGKMGFSLTRMLQRASEDAGVSRRIIAVSRFTQPGHEQTFSDHGIETVAGDLLEEQCVAGLPEVPNVVFMTGMKFGSGTDAPRTWAMNVELPAQICRRFNTSRVLAFSTGNVYPLVDVTTAGSRESDATDPVGEYAMTALGRERMFEYFSIRNGTPTALVRLNYAVEMRYGVLVDLAMKVHRGEPIDLAMGYTNVIWQGDANAWALCALAEASSPAFTINVAGPEILSVRDVCEKFGRLFDCQVEFINTPADTALLNNAARAAEKYGPVQVNADQLMQWIAAWIRNNGRTWEKPTHFQSRDGRF